MAVVRSVRQWRGWRDRAHIAEAVGVEQGRMRAMGMREGAARSEFQGMPAVVTCPQYLRNKKKGMNLEEELG